MTAAVDNLGIPPLAGLGSYEEAARPGYTVERTVDLLQRYQYVGRRLVEIMAAHLARTPEWEVKCALSLHIWLESQHVRAARERILEMRQPPPRLDVVPDAGLERWLDEAIRAETTTELLVSIYGSIKPELVRAMRKHRAETNPLADFPTRRVLKQALADQEEMLEWGEAALAAVVQHRGSSVEAAAWREHLAALLSQAGGIPGDVAGDGLADPLPLRQDGRPYEMDPMVQRDERFVDPYNSTADTNTYYREEDRPTDERILALILKRIREMDVPEWMAPIIVKTSGKPWDYYLDMTRQLWDEARHAMMGEVALVNKGVPFYKYPIDIASAVVLNMYHPPLESHLILWGIEQSLMRADGKRYEWELTQVTDDQLQKVFQDYDWADEVLHAQIGRRWLRPDFKSTEDMQARAMEAFVGPWSSKRGELNERSPQEPWFDTLMEEIRERAAIQAGEAPKPKAASGYRPPHS